MISPEKSKKSKNVLITVIICTVVVFLLLCFGGIFALTRTPEYQASMAEKTTTPIIIPKSTSTQTISPTSTLTPAPVFTATIQPPTDTPEPTITETPAPIFAGAAAGYSTPVPNLYQDILGNKGKMTDLQFKEFFKTLSTSRVHLEGSVTEVYEDGRVLFHVNDSGLFDTVSVTGIPKDVSVKISKNANIVLDATVAGFSNILGFQLDCTDPVIYSIE